MPKVRGSLRPLCKSLINLKKGRLHRSKDLFMLLRGEVEYNADPLMLGRVKVRIPSVHGIAGEEGSVLLEDLPWADVMHIRSSKDAGTFVVPAVGEKVWVLTEAGSLDSLVVLGSWFAIPDDTQKLLNPVLDENLEKIDTVGEGELETRKFWEVSHGTELIRELWDIRNFVPSKYVLFKSLKGALILIDDRDEEEALQIVDRLGQYLKFIGDVSEEQNLGNISRQTNIIKDNNIIPDTNKNVQLGSGKNKIRLDSQNGQEGALIETEKFKVFLDNTGKVEIADKGNSNKIVLDNDGNVFIKASQVICYGSMEVYGDIKVSGKLKADVLEVNKLKILEEISGDKRFN